MTIVTIRLPEIKIAAEKRPGQSLRCRSAVLQRWGTVRKPVRDPYLREVWIYRYRCAGCGKTFRQYPQGIRAADQTDRMRFCGH